MKQLEFNFTSSIPTFDTFMDNCKEGEICYCGKKKNPKLWYCSLECYQNNVKIRYESEGKKVPKQVETKLVFNWNEINAILKREEELLNY